MAFSALITLTTAGADTGPVFSLYSDINSYSIPFEVGVAKASLLAGYLSNLVPNGTTIIRVISFGDCNTAIDLPLTGFTTTTTSTSTSTTTTTSTTSTTTTGAPPKITLNFTFDVAITDIKVNGVTVSGFSYPVNPFDTPVFTNIPSIGVASTVDITAAGSPGSATLRITDSAGNHDLPWVGDGTYSFALIDTTSDILFTML